MASKEGTLLIEDAKIMFKNFAGKEGLYNREGDRNFCVLLDPELAETLANDGWNVKTLKGRDEDEPDRPYLVVSVGYKNRPPKIAIITSRGRSYLSEDEIEILDWTDMLTVDLVINPSPWSVNGKSGIKAYIKTLFATIEEDALEIKYADVAESNTKK